MPVFSLCLCFPLFIYRFVLLCFLWFVEVNERPMFSMCFCSKLHTSSSSGPTNAHKNTYPSVVFNLASVAAVKPDLEADQIRTRELELINLVKLLMRLAAVGLSQRVSHSGISLISHELNSQTNARKLFNICCVMNYVISSNQVMDKFASFQIRSVFKCLGAAHVCYFSSADFFFR